MNQELETVIRHQIELWFDEELFSFQDEVDSYTEWELGMPLGLAKAKNDKRGSPA